MNPSIELNNPIDNISNPPERIVYVLTHEPRQNSWICQLLAQRNKRVVCVASQQELLEIQTDHSGCCLLIFEDLDGANGVDVLGQLSRKKYPFPMILVMEGPNTAATVQAMQNGAYSVVDSLMDQGAIISTICNTIQQTMKQNPTAKGCRVAAAPFKRLGKKETEVLLMVLDGMPNKRIARHLGISMRTVENRRKKIYDTTGVNSIAQLVRLAIKAGIIQP